MSLANFHEVTFPLPLALAASGGPERKVEVVALASGAEARNAAWAGARRRWDIGSAATRIETLGVLTAFFEARGGRLHGFRFRDPLDHQTGLAGAAPSGTDEWIGNGDGTTHVFSLAKSYGTYRRRIHKPVADSVLVAVDGVPAELAGVNAVTGEVVFDVAPAAGAVVTAGFAFDCPVRFEQDSLNVTLDGFGAGKALHVPLVELVG